MSQRNLGKKTVCNQAVLEYETLSIKSLTADTERNLSLSKIEGLDAFILHKSLSYERQ